MHKKNDDLVQDGLVSIGEAAEFLAVSRSTLYELMDQGRLPYAKIGRSRRIPRRALIDLAQLSLRGGHLVPIINGLTTPHVSPAERNGHRNGEEQTEKAKGPR